MHGFSKKQPINAYKLCCRAELAKLEMNIREDTDQLQATERSMQEKRRAIAKDEEQLAVGGLQIGELQAELGNKELGKLSQAEVQEKQRLSIQLMQMKAHLSSKILPSKILSSTMSSQISSFTCYRRDSTYQQ